MPVEVMKGPRWVLRGARKVFYGRRNSARVPSVIVDDGVVIFQGFEAADFTGSFVLGDEIAQTKVSTLFRATVRDAPAESAPYTVKRVRRFLFKRKDKQALLEEVRILRELNYPNILGVHLFYRNDPTYFYVVLGRVCGGEMLDHFFNKSTYGEAQARDICKILVHTLKYLHSQGIVHGNFSPSTLLLADPDDDSSIVLTDFTHARSVRDGFVTAEGGTPEFKAPEILKRVPHGTSVDMWNVGIVAHIVLVGSHPFYHPDSQKMYRRVKEGVLEFRERMWDDVSNQAKDFVSKLLRVDPVERITAADATNHPWIVATNLPSTTNGDPGRLNKFKLYQAKRKLRSAVHLVLAGKMFHSMLSSKDFSHCFVLDDLLGKGAYADVYKARTVAPNPDRPRNYAVKRINRYGLSKEEEQDIIDEARILRELDHPNVMKIYDFYDNDVHFFYMVLELVDGGELFDRIAKMDHYNEEEARDACRVLLGAIDYIHGRGFVHRDLKPENILLVSRANNSDIKLADFGMACAVVDGLAEDQGMGGTPPYMAPELIRGDPYGRAVDMWSAGVIIFILLTGCYPFMDPDEFRLYAKIVRGHVLYDEELWSHLSQDAMDMVRGLLTVDPEQRLTARQAVEHPWLATSGDILSENDLSFNLPKFNSANAKRKLRSAISMVILARRLHEET